MEEIEYRELEDTGQNKSQYKPFLPVHHAEDDGVGDKSVIFPPEEEDSHRFRTLWAYTGPGWLMSMAFLDPGNLESDLQAGAYGGYQLVWVLFVSTVIGLLLQILAARLGVVTGRDLAQLCRQEYSRATATALWLMAEVAIIGSDIQEVIGSAIAFKLLFGWPLWVGCLVTGIDTFTFLGVHLAGIRALEMFFGLLVSIMGFSFLVDFGISKPDPFQVIGGFLPEVSDYAVLQAVGILGAIIMPHNIYLHSALVQSRKIDQGSQAQVKQAIFYFTIEATLALAVSFIINLAVVSVFAKSFYYEPCAAVAAVNTACVPVAVALASGGEIYNFGDKGACVIEDGHIVGPCDRCTINSSTGLCTPVGLSDAGEALYGLYGNVARTVWAVGLLAAGQASVMTGTYAGQFVMEGFWQIKVSPWVRTVSTRLLALGPAVLVATLSKKHADESDRMDEWLNILQSVQLPFALIPLLQFTGDEKLMGRFSNGGKTQALMYALGLLVTISNIYLAFKFLSSAVLNWWQILLFTVGCLAYFFFIFYLLRARITSLVTYIRSGCGSGHG